MKVNTPFHEYPWAAGRKAMAASITAPPVFGHHAVYVFSLPGVDDWKGLRED
jgi:hypothetical protein